VWVLGTATAAAWSELGAAAVVVHQAQAQTTCDGCVACACNTFSHKAVQLASPLSDRVPIRGGVHGPCKPVR
jgi:hypothetical protein